MPARRYVIYVLIVAAVGWVTWMLFRPAKAVEEKVREAEEPAERRS